MKRALLVAILIAGLSACASAPQDPPPETKPHCEDLPSATKKQKDGGIGGTGRGPEDCR